MHPVLCYYIMCVCVRHGNIPLFIGFVDISYDVVCAVSAKKKLEGFSPIFRCENSWFLSCAFGAGSGLALRLCQVLCEFGY